MKTILILLVLGALGYGAMQGYSWYSGMESLKADAVSVLEEYNLLKVRDKKYEDERTVFIEERARCLEYTRQGSGDFNEFEYCKKFLTLTENLSL